MGQTLTYRAGGVNRRQFLGRALAALMAMPLFNSPRLLAAEAASISNTPAGPNILARPLRKVKLGLVGCGLRGSSLAAMFQQHGGYEIHAVADYFQPVADASGDALGVDKARRFSGLSGYKRVLESGVEAVALETPPFFFPEHVRAALEAGKHVFMAKPVAVDVPGCLVVEAAARTAAAKRLCFLVDYQIPTDPHNVEVVRQIHAGAIGKLVMLQSCHIANAIADPARTPTLESRLRGLIWVNDVALGGGHHVNSCIHPVDAALWAAGARPISATGLSRIGRADPHGDSHDCISLTYEFADGLILNHRAKYLTNHVAGSECHCEVHAQAGHALLNYSGFAALRGNEVSYRQQVVNLYEAGPARNIAAFHKAILDGDCANPTVRRAVDGALTTILGREAARRGAKLTMDALLRENQRCEADLAGLKA